MIASFPDSLLRFRGELINELLEKNFKVHIAAPDLSPSSSLRKKFERNGIHVHEIPLQRTGINPIVDLGSLLYLIRLLRGIRPTCVLCYTIKPVIYGTISAWLARVPKRFALVTGLGYSFQGENKRSFLRFLVQLLYSFALRRAHKVFFQNPDDEALFRDCRLLPTEVPSCILNGSGVDLSFYSKATLPDSLHFLLVARLLGDKGIREYVDAAQKIRYLYPEVVFGLVGWIDENPDSIRQDELDSWVKDDLMHFYGRLEDVRPAIRDCSVYVLPSYREGTPRTVLEAMAMGRAIITTDTPGCRETVVDGENGILVPVKSVDLLVIAMLKFIENPGLASRMGKRSRQIAEEKYDVHKVNAVMLREMGIK